MYAHTIRQIENGLADWSKDFSEIETPILIKYVKSDVKSKKSIQYGENKKPVKKEETVFYCSISTFNIFVRLAGEKITERLIIRNRQKFVRIKLNDWR